MGGRGRAGRDAVSAVVARQVAAATAGEGKGYRRGSSRGRVEVRSSRSIHTATDQTATSSSSRSRRMGGALVGRRQRGEGQRSQLTERRQRQG